MTPLSTWSCDSCGQAIAGPTSGNVVWRWDADLVKRDFAIVHKGKQCDSDRSMQSAEISELLGIDGANWLLAMLDPGPIAGGVNQVPRVESKSFVDVFRRLQTPYYEEARQHFHHEHVRDGFSDANEAQPYTQWNLREIAEYRD